MSISKPYRECIVKVNKGSGCLVQPESDKYTYIFTAKHVLYKDREMAEQISPIVIQYKEGVKLNYLKQYEHPDKDIDAAVICVKKIDKWKSPKIDATGLQDGDKVKLCGFPAIRAKKEAGNQQDALDLEVYFDNNEGSILFARGKTLPVKDEVAGFSGGGVFQPTGKDLVLRGIEIQMHSGETPTGKIDFLHISTFLDIIEHYKLPGFKQKAFAHEDTARELLAVVKTRITEKLMQEDFIQFLPYLRTEYRVSTGTGKEQAAKEIAGRITPEKNLDSLFILLKCFNKYKEIRRDPDHLLWVKKTLKDIAAWKLITMINKEFYHGYDDN